MSARISTRRALTAALSTTVVGAALVLVTGGAAHAAVDPDDTTPPPVASDLIGVGSDTSQNALFRLANAYNGQTPAPANKLASFAATGGGDITLPSGTTIQRPNGSGAGKGRLYGANDLADIDYARSSSELNQAERDAGLQAFPFALDTLGLAVSGSVASNAPASLTEAQILGIYTGQFTTWNQVGGSSNAAIEAKIPQTGSGTRAFFQTELNRMNGGPAVTIAASIPAVQENDATPIKNNPNAIAPFSIGRAGLEGSALRVPGGFAANRALYNVVRGTALNNADIQAVFGPTGFVCSEAARTHIEAAGFKQLATAENDGVCGEATQAKSTDFTINTGPAVGDDPTFSPVSADLIGVGSDTSQHALALLANGYNGRTPAPVRKLASYAATGGGSIQLPDGTVLPRPNGSGAGKGRLYGSNNTPDIDYARSSAELNQAERDAGLQAFPFALDTIGMAVAGSSSNAPASLTEAQILGIYTGQFTTWNQVGGTSTAAIEAKIPQTGSGTRAFFQTELNRMNGGPAVTIAASIPAVQENDPAPIQNNPNAIAPFSIGRAGLLGNALRVPSGFAANRALYNVVRGTDLSNTDVQAIFGATGYVCSDAARSLIEQAGFKQLARPDADGVCGEATQAKTTDFTTNDPVVTVPTTTTLAVTSPAARSLRMTARVTGTPATPAPTGTVTFTNAVGGAVIGTAPLQGGVATLTRTVAPGAYAVEATYVPTAETSFEASESAPASTRVKTTSSITESFPSSVAKTKTSAKGVVTVVLAGTSVKATGNVVVKEGSKTVATGRLAGGKVTLTLTRAKVGTGKSTLKITYAGDANSTASSKTFAITFAKPTKK